MYKCSLVFKMDTLAKEILGIAFPSALAVAADPIASLIDTAFIGHLGTFFFFSLDHDAGTSLRTCKADYYIRPKICHD